MTALAILIGDTSLLVGSKLQMGSLEVKPIGDQTPKQHQEVRTPLPAESSRLAGLPSFEGVCDQALRLSNPLLSSYSLTVMGYLWAVDRELDLGPVKDHFLSEWEDGFEEPGHQLQKIIWNICERAVYARPLRSRRQHTAFIRGLLTPSHSMDSP